MEKHYTVVASDTPWGLGPLVETYLKNGWVLQGGVSVAVGPTGRVVYVQGVYKETKKD